ncbi:MAG: spore cortex biosynthesis protein YabQ [Lachnospiraceae bacterium]
MIEISKTIYREADFFLLSLVCGAALVFAYDLLRIVRELLIHSVAALAAEDLFYWLFAFSVIFYLLNEKNDGMVRLFFLLGVCAGMLLYNRFISPKFVGGIVWLVKKIFFILARPIRFFVKKLGQVQKFLQKMRKKHAIIWKKQLKKVCKVVKIGIGK